MNFTLDDLLETPLDDLLGKASEVRHKQFGNEIEFCAIVNAKSGRCAMDCRFCAQSVRYETAIESYPLIDGESLVLQTQRQWNRGIHRIGWVTSGCSVNDDEVTAITEAAKQCPGGRLCASLGQLDRISLRRLREAGITRYHHNLETSEVFYPTICTTQRWSDRLETVLRAKSLGFETCSGGLFGLGESWKDRYALAMVLRELDVDSVPINFLHPIPGTPFADRPVLSVEESLRIIAMFRLLLPTAAIRICGGRPTTFGERQSEIFSAGADAVMTGDYLTTNGISSENDFQMIRHLGLRRAEIV
jgi:biotin synthase